MSAIMRKVLEGLQPRAVYPGPYFVPRYVGEGRADKKRHVDELTQGPFVIAGDDEFEFALRADKLREIWGDDERALRWLRSGSLRKCDVVQLADRFAFESTPVPVALKLHKWATTDKLASCDHYDITGCLEGSFAIREPHNGYPRFARNSALERKAERLFREDIVAAVEVCKGAFDQHRGWRAGLWTRVHGDRVVWSTPDFGETSTPLLSGEWPSQLGAPGDQLIEALAIVTKGTRRARAHALAHVRGELRWLTIHGPDLDGVAVAVSCFGKAKEKAA